MNRTKLPIHKRLGNVPQFSGGVDAAVAEKLEGLITINVGALVIIDLLWMCKHIMSSKASATTPDEIMERRNKEDDDMSMD
ncbi:hypothetical protein AgCh_029360 [Apium graveolens]